MTPRERGVLGLIAQGLANAGIASALAVSPSAVEKHVNAIFSKLMLDPQETETHRRVSAVLTFLRHHAREGEETLDDSAATREGGPS